jgi:hypothetical protein
MNDIRLCLGKTTNVVVGKYNSVSGNKVWTKKSNVIEILNRCQTSREVLDLLYFIHCPLSPKRE